jgi:hypothetical protein
MRTYVFLALCFAVPGAAQTAGDAAPVPVAPERSYGSIAFGYRDGSAIPSYTLGGGGRVDAGTTLLSVRVGSARWSVAGESSFDGSGFLAHRHAVSGSTRVAGERTAVSFRLAYAYHSHAVSIFRFEDLETRSRRRIHHALAGITLSRALGRGVFLFGGPLGGAAYVSDSFDTSVDGELVTSRTNDPLSGASALFGFDAGLRWHWRRLTLDVTLTPLWTPKSTRAIVENDVLLSGGIALRIVECIGVSVRTVRTRTDRGIAHLGNTVTISVTAAYP